MKHHGGSAFKSRQVSLVAETALSATLLLSANRQRQLA